MTITSEKVNVDQSEYRKINSHLEIYTKGLQSPRIWRLIVKYSAVYIEMNVKFSLSGV